MKHCSAKDAIPPPGKWASGNHLWFIDIVAPVGNILPRIKRDLHQNYFADHNKAYAIRRKADGAIRRVQVWKKPFGYPTNPLFPHWSRYRNS
ncbi:toxin-activating lysine-acyltransferase [Sinorhizobium meliloti]|nr:toxin-activating lysine-acyltransferase [Sinorhizobium meliloti]